MRSPTAVFFMKHLSVNLFTAFFSFSLFIVTFVTRKQIKQKKDQKMRKTITRFLAVTAILPMCIGIVSCGKEKFRVNGSVANAKDSMLYFEHNGLEGFDVLDSVRLDAAGTFEFKGGKAENPEFYRLRIAGQIINIAIDSTETVNVKASYPMMATDYSVDGSYENEKIKELALKQIDLQDRCQAAASNPRISMDSAMTVIGVMVDAYKKEVERDYIYKEPMKAYAYFALFQYIVVNSTAQLIFNPRSDSNDIKVFGAVATSWDTFYPNSERGLNLHNIAIQGMKDQRIVRNRQQPIRVDASKVNDTGVIDIFLMDNHGKPRHLTELKGKVVMLDFHMFSVGEASTRRIMMLRELYNKYHEQGFEIYQVALDDNEHFWKMQTENLPWVNVYDPDGVNSNNVKNYNVQNIPTFFLIDKNNVLKKRDVQIEDIDAEIKAML